MSKLINVLFGVSGTTTIIALGGYLLSTQNTKKIKESFKNAIIDLNNDATLIKEKLAKLKRSNVLPSNSKLVSAQKKEKAKLDSGLEDFKEGCKEIYESFFSSKATSLFKEFKDYCARNIKDKIGDEKWFKNSPNWANRFEKLSKDDTKPFSKSLTIISKQEKENGDKLKKWCENIANEIFEGDMNLEFKDAKIYCGITD